MVSAAVLGALGKSRAAPLLALCLMGRGVRLTQDSIRVGLRIGPEDGQADADARGQVTRMGAETDCVDLLDRDRAVRSTASTGQ